MEIVRPILHYWGMRERGLDDGTAVGRRREEALDGRSAGGVKEEEDAKYLNVAFSLSFPSPPSVFFTILSFPRKKVRKKTRTGEKEDGE